VTGGVSQAARLLALLTCLAGSGCGRFDADTTTLASDPRRFEPLSGTSEVQAFVTAAAQLLEVDARHVRPDGTMDLEADYDPICMYKFRVAGTPDARPLGAGGGRTENTEVEVIVRRPGTMGSTTINGRTSNFFNRGMRKSFALTNSRLSPAPPPRCSAAILWQAALSRGAPSSAVARIVYDASGYELTIQDTPVRVHFDSECRPIAP
jgi:hypothetical protein